MVFWLAKPSAFSLDSAWFWAKISLFTIASALIVWTKVDFRKAAADGGTDWIPPIRVKSILAFDFIGLIVLAMIGRSLAVGV